MAVQWYGRQTGGPHFRDNTEIKYTMHRKVMHRKFRKVMQMRMRPTRPSAIMSAR